MWTLWRSKSNVIFLVAAVLLGIMLVSMLPANPPVGASRNVTAVSPEHRYDVIQSNVTRFYTLRVDKYTGKTWQLTERSSRSVWDEVRFFDGQAELANLPEQVNFQVLVSSLVPRDIYLWNVHTGTTWMIDQERDRGKLFWRKVDEQ